MPLGPAAFLSTERIFFRVGGPPGHQHALFAPVLPRSLKLHLSRVPTPDSVVPALLLPCAHIFPPFPRISLYEVDSDPSPFRPVRQIRNRQVAQGELLKVML
jgi:hypothetical protein